MKKSNLILMFIVLAALMGSLAAADIGETLGSAFDKILDVGSLKFLFGASADSQLIGFIRIAIAVLIFTILYTGLSLIPGLSRNITITIGVILAMITAVFLPASLLMAFGGTYATIFALLIIGAPLVGVGWLLFGTPTPGRGVALLKFLGTCFMIWLVNEISQSAEKLSEGAVTMLVDFSGFVESFVGWANVVLIIALIYFGWKIFGGGKIPEKLKEPFKRVSKTGLKGTWKETKDKYEKVWHGEEKALLGDYYSEQKELKKLEEAKKEIDENKLKEADKSTKKAQNLLKGRIRRVTRKLHHFTEKIRAMETELAEKGIKVGRRKATLDSLIALERGILKKHKEIKDLLDKALEASDQRSKASNIEEAVKKEKKILSDLKGLLALEKELLEK